MAAWYFPILWTHIGCAIASGALFTLRGGMAVLGLAAANGRLLRRVSVSVDTVLLAAGIALSVILQEYPFVQSWLTVAVLLLALYIALGAVALRLGRTRAVRGICFGSALVVFGLIVSVAYQQNPWGLFAALGA